MSTSGGNKAIVAALLANLGIAITKFIAWLVSGSSSMLAEGVHSLADTGNQLLLLRGGAAARKAADSEHPFGYGRERYVYAFVVSIILFSVGGVFSIYEGIDKLQHPHALENAWLPVLVLVIAMVLESFSLRTAVRESNRTRGKDSWLQFIRHSKAPELPVVLLEDVAALAGLVLAFLGVGLTIITGNGVFDAIGTLCIGVLLVLVAIVLGIETKSLLVGEGASPRGCRAHPQRHQCGAGGRVAHPHAHPLPRTGRASGRRESGLREQEEAGGGRRRINTLEARIREAVPIARVIFIEPDVYVAPADDAVKTEAIIIKASD